MPQYKIRSWQAQTLTDAEDYLVTAPTIQDAVARLAAVQEQAQKKDCTILRADGDILRVSTINSDMVSAYTRHIRVLDPTEITDSESGFTWLATDNQPLQAAIDLHCSTTDRSKAELFLVEGDSALNAEGRDSETQSIYALRGNMHPDGTTMDDDHPYLIVTGDVLVGFEFYGPYPNAQAASAAANTDAHLSDAWQIVPLFPPHDEK